MKTKYILYNKEKGNDMPFEIRGMIFSIQTLSILAVDLGDKLSIDVPIKIRNIALKSRKMYYDIMDLSKTLYRNYEVVNSDSGCYYNIDEIDSFTDNAKRTTILFGYQYTSLIELENEIIELLSTIDFSLHEIDI